MEDVPMVNYSLWFGKKKKLENDSPYLAWIDPVSASSHWVLSCPCARLKSSFLIENHVDTLVTS